MGACGCPGREHRARGREVRTTTPTSSMRRSTSSTTTSGDVVSQSYGECEVCMDPALVARQHKIFDVLSAKGVTLFASSGDNGAGQPSCDGSGGLFKSASTPASDPDVTGVGGTSAQRVAGRHHGWRDHRTWAGPPSARRLGTKASARPRAEASPCSTSALTSRPRSSRTRTCVPTMPDVAYNAAVQGRRTRGLERPGSREAYSLQWDEPEARRNGPV